MCALLLSKVCSICFLAQRRVLILVGEGEPSKERVPRRKTLEKYALFGSAPLRGPNGMRAKKRRQGGSKSTKEAPPGGRPASLTAAAAAGCVCVCVCVSKRREEILPLAHAIYRPSRCCCRRGGKTTEHTTPSHRGPLSRHNSALLGGRGESSAAEE